MNSEKETYEMQSDQSKEKKLRKTGIMGGTFNPIHVGHLMLAQWAMEEAGLDRIIFVPAGCPYMKMEDPVLPGELRLDMVRAAIEDNPRFSCSSLEIDKRGLTYSYETMEMLKEMLPDDQLYFIMGADCLFTMDNWKNPERILSACRIIAAARNGSSVEEMNCKRLKLEEKFGGTIHLLQFPAMEISSTDIRTRINEGKSIRYMVPEAVRQYIESNHLYRTT